MYAIRSYYVHKSTSYLAILILLIHLIMHFNFFEGFINKLIKNKNISKMLTTLLIIATLSAFAFSSVVSIVQSFFVSKKYSTSSVENDSNIRITSYNVCYTKLLRLVLNIAYTSLLFQ